MCVFSSPRGSSSFVLIRIECFAEERVEDPCTTCVHIIYVFNIFILDRSVIRYTYRYYKSIGGV